jgi:hypothetical protein
MSTEIIWVPKPDGKTWNSSRTRDLVDLAFTIEKAAPDLAVITIRCSKSTEDNSRARMVIGRVYVNYVNDAKTTVRSYVAGANTKSNKKEARDWLLKEMMALSLDYSPDGLHALNPGVLIDGVWHNRASFGIVATVPLSSAHSELENLEEVIAENPIEDMVNTIETIQEAIEPAIQQPKTLILNGKEIQLGWPQ